MHFVSFKVGTEFVKIIILYLHNMHNVNAYKIDHVCLLSVRPSVGLFQIKDQWKVLMKFRMEIMSQKAIQSSCFSIS
jgi:hypothetical protein